MAGIAPPPIGAQEAVGFGKESTYGTGVSATAWMRPIPNEFTLQSKDPALPMAGSSGVMVDTRYNATLPRAFRGTPDVSGDISVEANYSDVGMWLANALAAPGTAGSNPYTHTFNLAAAPPATMPVSLSVSRIHGLAAEHFRYNGGVINRLEISGGPNRIVTMKAGWIAQTRTGSLSLSEGTFATSPFIEFHHAKLRHSMSIAAGAGVATAQTGGAEILDFTLVIENGLRAVQAAGSGVRGIREPVYNGYRGAMLTINRDYFNDDFWDQEYAATIAGMFSTVEIELIGVAATYELSLYMPAAVVQTPEPLPSGVGVVPETVTWKAAYDGTNAPFTAKLINATSAY
jgi:hypothetical protein